MNVTSPGFVIVGGLSGNQGVVIARDPIGTNHTHWLSDDEWYVAQTNRDIWRDHEDTRYNATIRYMDELGQSGVERDGVKMIESVLWKPNVLESDTIFTSTQTAFYGQRLNLYEPPNRNFENQK